MDKEEVKKILRKVANVGGTDAIVKMENMELYLDIKSQEICQLFDSHLEEGQEFVCPFCGCETIVKALK